MSREIGRDAIEHTANERGFEVAHNEESWHGDVTLEMLILVKMSNRKLDVRDREHVYKAARDIKRGLDTVTAELDPRGAEIRENHRRQIADIYRDAGVATIYMEPLPNGYCSNPCCLNKPWFRVTSAIGHVVLGWRRSVMSIDWKDSLVKDPGEVLFPDENVTRWETGIHAHSTADATQYIKRLHEQRGE